MSALGQKRTSYVIRSPRRHGPTQLAAPQARGTRLGRSSCFRATTSCSTQSGHRWLVRHRSSFLVYVFQITCRAPSVISALSDPSAYSQSMGRQRCSLVCPMGTFICERHGNSGISVARLYQLLPGRNGATKGLTFGLIGWMFMGLILFRVIGLGPFAFGTGLGIAPAVVAGHVANLQCCVGHGICRARYMASRGKI
jgi:hypothetical protein